MVGVWLDALTPKQFLFMACVAEELKGAGVDVLLTTREYDELDALATRIGIEVTPVGRHGGAALENKLEASIERMGLLYPMIKEFKPDVVATMASPEAARIAYGLGTPLIIFNDSPHSTAVARLVVPLATALYSPWPIRLRDWVEAGTSPHHYDRYKALDPVAWLRRRNIWPKRMPWEDARGAVVIRSGEKRAYYYHQGKSSEEELAMELARRFRVILLARYGALERGIQLPENVRIMGPGFFGPYMLEGALAFVGYGGTMTQEAVLLGVPALSVHPSRYRIEEYLEERRLLRRLEEIGDVVDVVEEAVRTRRDYSRMAATFERRLEDPAVFAAEKIMEEVAKQSL